MNVLHEISIFINKINYIDLSYEVIHAVKRAFIDTMGVSLIGTKEKVSKLITEFVKAIKRYRLVDIVTNSDTNEKFIRSIP